MNNNTQNSVPDIAIRAQVNRLVKNNKIKKLKIFRVMPNINALVLLILSPATGLLDVLSLYCQSLYQ